MVNMGHMSPEELQTLADKARLDLIERTEGMKETIHWGSAFSLMEIGSVLLSNIVDPDKDMFFLSKGHGAPGIYAIMHQTGALSNADWESYRKDGSKLTELMEYHPAFGFHFSGGSLGLAPSYASGMALLWKKTKREGHIYVLMGDGEVDEGSVWEAFMSSGHFQLDNITLVIDANGLQSDGRINEVMTQPDRKAVLREFGWTVYEVNGHDCTEMNAVFCRQPIEGKPTIVICHTVKGRGVSFMEGDDTWHDRAMTDAEFQTALEEAKRCVAGRQ